MIKEILAPLYKLTKDLEGCVVEEHHEGMLYEVIMTLEGISEHLSDH